MAATMIEPTDIIDVSFVPVIIFGAPGSWKTTLAQTADDPITLDFDRGIHRCTNRRKAMRFDSWPDVVEASKSGAFAPFKTIVVDTLGRLLDMMTPVVASQGAKNCGPSGLSPQGWGVLGSMFAQWIKTMRDLGKDLVMICHEETSTSASGNPIANPDMPGKMSWKEIHKWTDLIGRIRYEGNQRVLDFNPDEVSPCCKNAAQWPAMKLPNLQDPANANFLGKLIAEAKAKIGKTAEDSAKLAAIVQEWRDWIARDPGIDRYNADWPRVGAIEHAPTRKAVWSMIADHARAFHVVWSNERKQWHWETGYEPSTPTNGDMHDDNSEHDAPTESPPTPEPKKLSAPKKKAAAKEGGES